MSALFAFILFAQDFFLLPALSAHRRHEKSRPTTGYQLRCGTSKFYKCSQSSGKRKLFLMIWAGVYMKSRGVVSPSWVAKFNMTKIFDALFIVLEYIMRRRTPDEIPIIFLPFNHHPFYSPFFRVFFFFSMLQTMIDSIGQVPPF